MVNIHHIYQLHNLKSSIRILQRYKKILKSIIPPPPSPSALHLLASDCWCHICVYKYPSRPWLLCPREAPILTLSTTHQFVLFLTNFILTNNNVLSIPECPSLLGDKGTVMRAPIQISSREAWRRTLWKLWLPAQVCRWFFSLWVHGLDLSFFLSASTVATMLNLPGKVFPSYGTFLDVHKLCFCMSDHIKSTPTTRNTSTLPAVIPHQRCVAYHLT